VAESSRDAISRRRLLGGAAAGAGGLAAGGMVGAPAASAKRSKHEADVVVVGAGFAGLAAAKEIRKGGHSVAVLEARDRVGGRVLNAELRGGEQVELGGQWVGPGQDRVLALISELGLSTYPTNVDGDNIYYRDGTLQTYTGTIPPAQPAALVEVATALGDLNKMAAEVPRDAPETAPHAAEWDSQTFETWKLANMQTQEGRDLLDLAFSSVFAAEPRDVSLLFTLFYIATAGSFDNLINTAGGAQEDRIVGGSQRIALKLAKKLGKRVRLSQPVHLIRRRGGRMEVHGRTETWTAKRVIVALAPALIDAIEFKPKLPPMRAQLNQRVPMGSVIKCMAVYDTPFWRARGLCGMATSNTGPVKLTFDNTPASGSPGVLLGFMEGTDGRRFAQASEADRRAAVLGSFERYFGAEALNATAYLDKVWAADVWSRGCYVGYMPPGVLLEWGSVLRAPVGRIHWAGTETATLWAGYMDGALESGQRAAAEVLATL
jgi:monoamine oxidase